MILLPTVKVPSDEQSSAQQLEKEINKTRPQGSVPRGTLLRQSQTSTFTLIL